MEEVSKKLSRAFHFLKLLPDSAEMQEKLMLRINDQEKLLEVLLQVMNPEYHELCKKAYGMKNSKSESPV